MSCAPRFFVQPLERFAKSVVILKWKRQTTTYLERSSTTYEPAKHYSVEKRGAITRARAWRRRSVRPIATADEQRVRGFLRPFIFRSVGRRRRRIPAASGCQRNRQRGADYCRAARPR